jgi:hypothetical protein
LSRLENVALAKPVGAKELWDALDGAIAVAAKSSGSPPRG